MTDQPCMWCGQPEQCEQYSPPKGTEYLCSKCTLKLTMFSKDNIKALRSRLVEKELHRFIDILDNFTGGEHATGNTRDTEKRINRTRTVRAVKTDKAASIRPENKKRPAIRQAVRPDKTIFRERPDRFL